MTDIDENDKQLFRQTVDAITPIAQNNYKKSQTLSDVSEWTLSDHCTEICQAESILCYSVKEFSSARFVQLKKGLIPWGNHLDLHGYTQEQARHRLISFIVHQSIHSRCVLIIHGKGSRHFEPPVLKNLVNSWLKQLPQVLAFHSALPKHGGTGAVYALLKQSLSF